MSRLASALLFAAALPLLAQSLEPGGIMRHLAVAKLRGSGIDTIRAVRTDPAGNIYLADTTSSVDLPVTAGAVQTAAGASPLFRSTDGGLTWSRVPPPQAVPLALAVHPRNPFILIAVALNGIYRTGDAGRTWSRAHGFPPPAFDISEDAAIAFDPAAPRWVYARAGEPLNLILASADGGVTWQQRPLPPAEIAESRGDSFWVDPTGSGALVTGRHVSRDHAATFTALRPYTGSRERFYPDPWRQGRMFIAHPNPGVTGQLLLSTDWGRNADRVQLPTQPGAVEFAINSLAFDPDQRNTVYVSVLPGMLRSRDAGNTFEIVPDGTWRASASPVVLPRVCGDAAGIYSTFGILPGFGDRSRPLSIAARHVAAGPDCTVYATLPPSTDAFAAKLTPAGELIWATYLGGSNGDGASDLRLGADGDVYVAGVTGSSDFPGAPPLASPTLFVARLDAQGSLRYARTVSAPNATPRTLAIGADGAVHLVGHFLGSAFPATPGAASVPATEATAFALKLSPAGELLYNTLLARIGLNDNRSLTINPQPSLAALVEKEGSLLIGGYQGMLVRLSSDGAGLTELPTQPGQIVALDSDSTGSVILTGTANAPAGSSSCFQGFYQFNSTLLGGDTYVAKLRASTLQPEWRRFIAGNCRSWPSAVSIAADGAVTLGLWVFNWFPVVNPILPVSTCGLAGSAAVARLAPDGSAVTFASFIDNCSSTSPLVTGAPDGSILATVSNGPSGGPDSVLRLQPPPASAIAIAGGVSDALTGLSAAAAPGRLLHIDVTGATSETADVGLNRPNPLPNELAGVRVLFDGAPAGLFRVSPDSVICVVPPSVAGKESVRIRIVNAVQESAEFILPVKPERTFRMLTSDFPSPPKFGGPTDAIARNADGTLNSPDNPAAPGTTLTIFGMEAAGTPLTLLWNAPPRQRFDFLEPFQIRASVSSMNGFIAGLQAISFRIPDRPSDGKVRRDMIGRVNEGYGVYTK